MLGGLLTGIFAVSLILTRWLRHYALAKQIMDLPNHRSSHLVPTPRGGGLAFVVSFLVLVPFLTYGGYLERSLAVALMLPGLLIATLGFWDDRKGVPASWRLAIHILVAVIVLFYLGGMPALHLGSWLLPTGWISSALAVFYLVWLLNLYNFMDGIDLLAGTEAIFVCLGAALLYALNNNFNEALLLLCLAAAVSGFLYWNFPPARIFMGDVGSGFLGLIFAVLSIHAASVNEAFFWSWLILLGVFIVDASVTLLRRFLIKEPLFEAHCSHAYQHASRYLGSHLTVAGIVSLINIFWLLPVALLVGQGYLAGFTGLCIAWFPLFLLAIKFRAGQID